jgi:hypothetical protein
MRKITILASVACLALIGASAHAAVSWTVPAGDTADFHYASGRSDFGRWGDPIIQGNSFIFEPSSFIAQAADGGSQNTNDTLRVTITALNPTEHPITGVIVQELGDYMINGAGTVQVSGTLTLTRTSPFTIRSDSLDLDPSALSSGFAGQDVGDAWDGLAAVDLSGESTSWTTMSLVMSNILQVTSTAGSDVWVAKTGGIVVTIVPEPTSVILFAGAAGLLLNRRRRA